MSVLVKNPISREEAITQLRDLADNPDHEDAHSEADEILLNLLSDDEVRQAYEQIERWFA